MGGVIPTLDMNVLFGYAGDIVTRLLPFVYVTAGISLGFAVISRIISAFK